MPGMFSSNFDRYGAAGRSGSNGATNTSTVPMSVLHAEGNRTVYIGGISPEAACEDICNAIRGGVLSKIRYFPAKHIAFVTFADPEAASNFLKQGSEQGVVIKARRVKVNWGQNAHALPLPVIQAFSNGATRNVYLGGVEGILDAAKIRQDFTEFGEVELVNMLSEKNCGFVNFTDVMSAVKAVEGIKRKPEYVNIRVNYGKDRCGNPPKANRTASSTEEGQAGPATNSATAAENNGRDSTNSRDFDEDDEMFQA
ncbi:hypothetical protein BGW38_003651 [Lunasporangiospora selenospora]|uniref:RRM domain-containing protein n=1 Tax=Lunasporangiospora selenospora TaxID=979761 RepID=A0A9P6FR73_9FUNG|nr:hypothetical protein BGW38_003651 [Lunasporangiospora selenospora]